MQIQQIRNATFRMTYAGKLFLTDPVLSPRHAFESFVGISRNPLTDLPCTPQEVINSIEMVILSHLHPDHFDRAAQDILPKNTPIFCQPGDEKRLAKKGFHAVTVIEQSANWQGIKLIRTHGQHGTGIWAERMGDVSGYVFQAENEPTVYWAGDTIWCDAVRQVVADVQPDIIVTHSCGAKFPDSDPIIMDAEQTITVCRAAPKAVVVAIHMEALDHATVSRDDLRAFARRAGIANHQLLIPVDGEILSF
ncbi:MAG: MBL fold metallo-hydrolase [Deltaproteobacteria bacterium]|nr:MBL fold metallo-hydrolase [Deltaproteobacteria bacterium]